MEQDQAPAPCVDNITNEVIFKVAEAADDDPFEITPPLYEVIDTDALESMFSKNRTPGKIVFNYNGCEVSVFSDGYVSVNSR